ncbi:hypothetical protein GGD92_25530 [Pseudomonas protegens]|uniref:Uncharacterized protein n=1 Tax=Pseudomonas protegens TaxID=380021 RepID=A0A7G7X6V6_9PSED|nr:hypothetical protein [Pseudomonas protegens]QNH75701.1 hypothetical protein GGI48_20605 [Pseudomonas protegens]QNL04895.1 hypothetical protein GGD92_25530 [Pseudomonas protegens]
MHILQRKAKTTEHRDISGPEDATYDFDSGVWRNEAGLVAYDPRHAQSTKKNDIETGEDQKGQ